MRKNLAGGLAFLLAGIACGSPRSSPPAEREVLVLGSFGEAAGARPGARAGATPALRGVELAVKEYNRDKGSTYQFTIKQAKAGRDEGAAKAAADGLAKTQRLVGTVGPFTSGETNEAAPVLEQASIPFLTTSVSSDGLPEPDWRSFRRLVANDRQQGQILARRTNGPVAIFHDGTPLGRSFADGAKAVLDEAKRPIARFEKISGTTNLPVVSGNVAQQKPSGVLYGGDGALGRSLADALRKANFKGLIIASHQILQTKSTGLPDGVVTASMAADPSDPAIKEFKERYTAEFSSAPGQFSVEAYEGAWMLLEAVEEVEPKPKVVAEFFRLNRSFLGDSKSYNYDDKGELRAPTLWIYESKGGEWDWTGRSRPARQQRSE